MCAARVPVLGLALPGSVVVLALGACADGALEEHRVEVPVDLMPHAARVDEPDARGGAGSVHDQLYTSRVVRAHSDQPLVLDGLDLPGDARLELEVVLPRQVDILQLQGDVEVRITTARGDTTTRRVSVSRRLAPGQSGVPLELELEQDAPVERIELELLSTRYGEAGEPVLWVRPTAYRTLRVSRTRDAPRQVVVVTLDTARADRFGFYGDTDAQTPELDRLAAESAVFESAYSTSNATLPAHSSLFTSLYVKDHGVTSNFETLGEGTPTMIDALRARGFRTAAFLGSHNFSAESSQLPARFDEAHRCVPRDRRADDVLVHAIPWLADHVNDDFLAWIHLFDAHAPYAPPDPYGRRAQRGRRTPAPASRNYSWFNLKSHGLELMHALYRAEIAYVDAQLGRLFRALRELGIENRATIVVTADHGEALGELDFVAYHSGLTDATTRVPLIVRRPGAPDPKRIEGLVSLVDVYPTLFDLLDLGIEHPIRGRSLVPLLETGERSTRERVFFESANGIQAAVRTADHSLVLGLADKRYDYSSYVVRPGQVELYANGGADEDVAAAYPDLVRSLRAELDAFLEDRLDLGASAHEGEGFSSKMEALGYTR